MTSHVQHHYLPNFLLDEWHSGSDHKLTAFRWAGGQVRASRNKAKSVARLEHLYSIRRPSGELDTMIERDFMGPHVDDPAAKAHQALLTGPIASLTEEQMVYWGRFVATLPLRHPDTVRKIVDVPGSGVRPSPSGKARRA